LGDVKVLAVDMNDEAGGTMWVRRHQRPPH
jgi:hypothetical protein